MTVPVQIVHGNFSHKALGGAILRDGSVVAARVISQNGNGSYTVSLAGQMIDVRSEANLTAGEVFSAKVKIAGNQISLSLVQDSKSSGELIQKFSPQNQQLSPQVQQFLSSLGFESNLESFKIIQFMQQIGVKINAEAAKKALAQSKKNGVASEEKSQVALLLEEKGIKVSDKRVSAILGNEKRKNENGKRQKKEERNEELGARSEKVEIDETVSGGMPDSFQHLRFRNKIGMTNSFETAYVRSVRNFFTQVDSASLSHKNGVLSAFNTVLSSRKNEIPLNHWIVLPFEWNFRDSFGTIRLLFDSELKSLQKAIIDLKNSANQHKFSLGFEKNQLSSVRFATSLAVSDDAKNHLSNLFLDFLGKSVAVERVDFDSLRGFCADDEIFAHVQGAV